MQRIVIFGNSGSGKSTQAQNYVTKYKLPHLDLDILAWRDTSPPTRLPFSDSAAKVQDFLDINQNWVIEGCYSDLLELVISAANEVLFLNPGEATCVSNCKARPWEPHKYASPEEQNKNLNMLLNWIRQYADRGDEFSLSAHRKLFNNFTGTKTEFKSNDRNA